MMVGSKLKSPKKSKSNFGAAILEVNNLSLKSLDPFGTSLKNITFNLRAGEVMGARPQSFAELLKLGKRTFMA